MKVTLDSIVLFKFQALSSDLYLENFKTPFTISMGIPSIPVPCKWRNRIILMAPRRIVAQYSKIIRLHYEFRLMRQRR